MKFKAISFFKSGDLSKGFFFYDMTLAEALDKMLNGLTYVLDDKGIFSYIKTHKGIDIIKDFEYNISICYY